MDISRVLLFLTLFLSILSDSQAGIKIAIKDKLIQDLGSIGLPDLFNSLNESLAVPHNFSFEQKIFGIDIKLNVTNFIGKNFKIDASKSNVTVVSKNHAIFIQTPKIQKWEFTFKYDYHDLFGHSEGQGDLTFVNCLLNTEMALKERNNNLYLQIDGLTMQLGSTKISLSQGFTPKIIEFLFNDFKYVPEMLINWGLPAIINMLNIPIISFKLPVFGQIGIDFGFEDLITRESDSDTMYFKSEFFDIKTNVYPFNEPSTNLHNIVPSSKTVSILMNEILFNSFFKTLDYTNVINIILTNSIVHSKTKFLYLTTSDLIYYLPQLIARYNDTDLQVKVGDIGGIPPHVHFNKLDQSIMMNGSFFCLYSPLYKKAYNDSMEFRFNISLEIKPIINTVGNSSNLTISMIPIRIDNLSYISHDGTIFTDTAGLQAKLNNIFKYVGNGVNTYGIKDYPLPSKFGNIMINNPAIIINDSYVSLDADVKVLAPSKKYK